MIGYLCKRLNFRELSVVLEHRTHGGRDLLTRLLMLRTYPYYATPALDPDLDGHDCGSFWSCVCLHQEGPGAAGPLQHYREFHLTLRLDQHPPLLLYLYLLLYFLATHSVVKGLFDLIRVQLEAPIVLCVVVPSRALA